MAGREGEVAAWGAVVPVKRLDVAKSRLAAYGEAARRELALAFAADVVTAALRCCVVHEVVVVTDDPDAAVLLTALGGLVVADDPDAGLNPALAHGAGVLHERSPRTGVVALSADLPALRADDLASVLGDVPAMRRAFVSDAEASGTTLLAAPPGTPLLPSYGRSSRARHLAAGAVELAGTPRLRRDVDTAEDLAAALELGVGPHTAAVAARLGAGTMSP